MRLPANLYQQFSAPGPADSPATPGGWKRIDVELAPAHTAVVVMHAWDCGSAAETPGRFRAVEYLPRAQRILHDVFPRLLAAVRLSPLHLFHVVGGGDYYQHLSGYRCAADLAGEEPLIPQIEPDPAYDRLRQLRREQAYPGIHHMADVQRSSARLDFARQALPLDAEGIAENGGQLTALCRAHHVNHLIYVGFAINWCLLMSPGGMIDMSRHGCLCSTIEEAVTAVENHETAEHEREKAQALWRVAVEFGFVFHLDDFLRALPSRHP